MKNLTICIYVSALMLLTACSEHFISDATVRASVQQDFEERVAALPSCGLEQINNSGLNNVQREALTFLYAYMPLCDIVDHDLNYFINNVNTSLKAREEMPWGKIIPENLFRHFVLPIRVNNENLDESRMVFYDELKDRVKGLSLLEAVLEVNHWCHEKVVYTPSDSRTSSPLASVKTAYGRCGEESTFTVAALRSVGIPARQVYTPRWAHTDDNHAWVEAWVDGSWKFLGACEPEPVLNLGWFNAPASRGMLMHSKVFGKYKGEEMVLQNNPLYTEINVTDNYTPCSTVVVNVVDKEGNLIEGALVEFKVYNYAEFYTMAKATTDNQGKAYLAAGKGDMLIWVSKDGKFGYQKVSFKEDNEVTIAIHHTPGESMVADVDIVPPVENTYMPEVTEEQRELNTVRMALEDSIRNSYVATFMTEEAAKQYAQQNDFDEDEVARLVKASRGNHKTIIAFLDKLKSPKSKKGGIDLLNRISAKDLRDVSLEVLVDHMQSHVIANAEDFKRYVRNPRVSNELLTPYKAFFKQVIDEKDAEAYRNDPMLWKEWVAQHIIVDEGCNVGGAPISPAGVWKAKKADKHSRDIFFVAAARSMGIPARIDEVTGKVQIITQDAAVDVFFETQQESLNKGSVKATYSPSSHVDNPKYYSHFTISKITESGTLQLLNYEEGDADMGAGTSWASLLKNPTRLDEGNYVMVTGTRMSSGAVLSQMTFFTVKADELITLNMNMRESMNEVQVIGNFDSESLYRPIGVDTEKSILSTTGRGYYAIAVLGVNQEPTNHALRDIAALCNDFNTWGRPILLLFPSEEQYNKFNAGDFGTLPSTITYGIDEGGKIQAQIVKNMKLNETLLPVFVIADTFNRVVFSSQGYTIGLGEQMMQIIHKL